MKSFKQYITEVERYADEGWGDWLADLPLEFLELIPRVGGTISTVLTMPSDLARDDQPPAYPPWNPPWHDTHPNNNWDNPPPGWQRVKNVPHYHPDYFKFRFTPRPKNGTFEWIPSGGPGGGGYWQEIVGPPKPDDDYGIPSVPLDGWGQPIVPGHPDWVWPNLDDINQNWDNIINNTNNSNETTP